MYTETRMGGCWGSCCRKTHDALHSGAQSAPEGRLRQVSWSWGKSTEEPHVERSEELRPKQDHNSEKTKWLFAGFTDQLQKAQRSRTTAKYCTLPTAIDVICCWRPNLFFLFFVNVFSNPLSLFFAILPLLILYLLLSLFDLSVQLFFLYLSLSQSHECLPLLQWPTKANNCPPL